MILNIWIQPYSDTNCWYLTQKLTHKIPDHWIQPISKFNKKIDYIPFEEHTAMLNRDIPFNL